MEEHRSKWKTMLFLFFLCAVVYNSNGQFMPSGDTRPASLLPFSILLDRTTTLDRFFESDVGGATGLSRMTRADRSRYYYISAHRGHLHSNYPVTTPVLVTPLYAPLVWLRSDWTTEELLLVAPYAEKIAASVIAALSVVVMYLLLVGLTSRRRALVLSLALAFATSTWTTSSQALWQHGPGVLFILLTLATLVYRPNTLWLAGLAAGSAAACRPTNVLFLFALIAVVVVTHRSIRSGLMVGVPAAAVLGPVILYNQFIYGDIRGGYAVVHQSFRTFLPEGLAGVLVSPSRGLLVYSPFLVAGFLGLYLVLRDDRLRRSAVYSTAAIFAVSHILFFAWWKMWWGGWSYGPRLLTEAAAVLVVLCVPALDRLQGRRWVAAVFTMLLLYSGGVQALGALAYSDPGWNGTPVNVDRNPRRLWGLRDTQIRRTTAYLRSGKWHAGCRNVREWLMIQCPTGASNP